MTLRMALSPGLSMGALLEDVERASSIALEDRSGGERREEEEEGEGEEVAI